MTPEGLVTVVVSVFNVEKYLPRCLESIAAQTYRNLEILLIDDGSTDGSGRLCDEFASTDSRARVIHQENRGLWVVRNRGVEEAKGEYLVFPDGDDYFHRDYIRLLYEAINLSGKEYPLAICDYEYVNEYKADSGEKSGSVVEVMDHDALLDKIVNYPSCMSALWGGNWNKLYRKSSLPIPFQKEYRRCQDYDSNLRVFFHIDCAVYVKEVLYYWVQWPGQSSRTPDDFQIRNECRCRIFQDHIRTIPSHLSAWRPGLLIDLYRRLLFWKDSARGTEQFKTVSKTVREIEKDTWRSFLSCKQMPFRRRIRWLLSLHVPSFLKKLGKSIPNVLA
ncbi:MAG: glycosyltransferase [Bacteroidales bacterium]|nr:glycosyltransferase [Bacteroidales bacterium]